MLTLPVRSAAVAGALALTLATWSALAVPFGEAPVRVSLTPEVTAERYAVPCGAPTYATSCIGWRLEGLAAPLPAAMVRANMFAGARGGRLVAALPGAVAFSDDRGLHWREARWEGGEGPLSLAFDARSDFGVAVGTNGSVWTSEDRGETWRRRRDRSGQRLIDVAVVGRTIAFADEHGGVWVSPDGGTSVRTLAEHAEGTAPTLQVRERALWVFLGGTVWWRADAHGSLERVDPAVAPRR
jgi:photosystem II stability/assembly factor-like uncharacterized protein